MTRRRAIVTLVVGDTYQQLWNQHCRAGWVRYAQRHDLDLIVLDTPLDTSRRAAGRSPAWQKLLIPGQTFASDYEQILWLDADIVIHPDAPSVFAGVPLDRVAAVDEFSNPTAAMQRQAIRKWAHLTTARGGRFQYDETARDAYRAWGFARGFDRLASSAVLVLSPQRHRDVFAHVYDSYDERPDSLLNLEMRPLSYALLDADLVHWLDPRFNLLWQYYKLLRCPFLLVNPRHPMAARCAAMALAESHFLHFAGNIREIALLADNPQPAPVALPWTMPRPPGAARRPACAAPVALFAFNRPATTERVLAAIRAARPQRLFLIADGPRAENPADGEQCAAVRTILAGVDWECDVERNYAPRNLGLRERFHSGLEWLFTRAESAIILEDDCLPDPSFFPYCEELLERYRDEPEVTTISGTSFTFDMLAWDASYHFSRYPLIWGWATWRRAWRAYDPTASRWPHALASGWLRTLFDDPRCVQYWEYVLQENVSAPDVWDYAWLLSSWLQGGLAIHPRVNLVSNIGFGGDASHTRRDNDVYAALPTAGLDFPLRHPARVERDDAADHFIDKALFSGSLDNLWHQLRNQRRAARATP